MPFSYPYPRPAVSCDVVVFTMRHDDLAVLLVRRRDEPFKGSWALPGGFLNENESLERAATRELYEETGVSSVKLEQLATFGDPGRDPRGHTVTVAWLTFLVAEVTIVAGDDAAEAAWHPLRTLDIEGVRGSSSKKSAKKKEKPSKRKGVRLAFDHAKIIAMAYQRLCRHLDTPLRDVAFDLLPPRFTLAELRRTYEVVFGKKITPHMVKKQLVVRGLVVPATSKPAPKPSAQLYRWNRR
ncbi:ADP-ribose pyrophosphatase [Labilithrix luteola]|uniref:ADP-ribose pyrophosphatase n=1 Tax=Labilithrix luteola TaxID=1391654 RepID=A0A0K1PVI7_9BACT|nr:NUDIX domain-containing protein [Labilithrix luteola]AKU97542.1 ADP-ribose pyrophosphatase [Labilithrix luteola]